MGENMKDSGSIIKCMERVLFRGRMGKYILESIKRIKRKGMGNLLGILLKI